MLQARSLQHLDGIHESIVADHFETFTFSQLDALGVATPVGHDSWFVYSAEPAPHRQETIAFSRRINATMERMFLLLVWRNFVKGRSERRPDRSTAAMRLGLTKEPWTWSRVLARRLFSSRAWMPASWKKIYMRDWDEAEDVKYRRHRLKNAA